MKIKAAASVTPFPKGAGRSAM